MNYGRYFILVIVTTLNAVAQDGVGQMLPSSGSNAKSKMSIAFAPCMLTYNQSSATGSYYDFSKMTPHSFELGLKQPFDENYTFNIEWASRRIDVSGALPPMVSMNHNEFKVFTQIQMPSQEFKYDVGFKMSQTPFLWNRSSTLNALSYSTTYLYAGVNYLGYFFQHDIDLGLNYSYPVLHESSFKLNSSTDMAVSAKIPYWLSKESNLSLFLRTVYQNNKIEINSAELGTDALNQSIMIFQVGVSIEVSY